MNGIAARVDALEQAFRRIAATRMADVPLLHPGLRVQAVGFAPLDGDAPCGVLCGVLVTPWFMSLLRLPSRVLPAIVPDHAGWLDIGRKAHRAVGGALLEFIGAAEPDVGVYEAASLFSPMHEFADHEAALATAQEVLRQLRAPLPAVLPARPVPQPDAAVPSRRGFLLGRSAAAGRA